ncbi:hypothetical protein [Microbulbifer sp. 2205BS26-8]|uniref:hypothetical protein n=1 Tax=Microbulbifer sp. 2205BS26-8 TaxID=3064386 RepID=UPI00273F36EE|nr:hypothetical protein [Microbulbifer sp. 2205BS26-8]MDP5210803.1 hypothetical protein [Microbulbifer sp. 2205BS26-8]
MLRGLRPNLWRAPDNDAAWMLQDQTWKSTGGDAKLREFRFSEGSGGALIVNTVHRLGGNVTDFSTEYWVRGTGEILVNAHLNPLLEALPVLPRVGMNLVLPGEFKQLEWFGRGPHENYEDPASRAHLSATINLA